MTLHFVSNVPIRKIRPYVLYRFFSFLYVDETESRFANRARAAIPRSDSDSQVFEYLPVSAVKTRCLSQMKQSLNPPIVLLILGGQFANVKLTGVLIKSSGNAHRLGSYIELTS